MLKLETKTPKPKAERKGFSLFKRILEAKQPDSSWTKDREQIEELEGASRHFTSFSTCLFCLHLLSLSIPSASEDGSGVRIRGAGCGRRRVVKGKRTSFTRISFMLSSVGRVSVIEQEETFHFWYISICRRPKQMSAVDNSCGHELMHRGQKKSFRSCYHESHEPWISLILLFSGKVT